MRDLLNIAYITGREDNHIQWFLLSLAMQAEAAKCWGDLRLIIIDRFYENRYTPGLASKNSRPDNLKCELYHSPPKPTVWAGKHRLASQDYFAVANARNTALCLAEDGYIAYVDDLSVLMPGWLSRVRVAQAEGNIYLGAYKKVKNLKVENLKVENGVVVSYDENPGGVDSRWNLGSDANPVPCTGSMMFGCSLAAPVQAFLNINGWDEDCDCCGMGGEDYIAGMMLDHQPWKMYYDRQMLTLESEELHHVGEHPVRMIETKLGSKDASHVMLDMVKSGKRNTAPNYFGAEGIAGLRQRVLAGEPFPVMKIPEHSWFSGKALSEY